VTTLTSPRCARRRPTLLPPIARLSYRFSVTRPSSIPDYGRALKPEEQAALVEEMAEIIEKSHLFKSLGPEGRRELLEAGYVMSFGEGDMLLKQGDPGGNVMYLIIQGRVLVETESLPGKTVRLAELSRGACLGEVSLLKGGGERTATVTAMTDVDVVAFAKHRIDRVLDDHPKVREILQSLVDARARDTIEKIIG